MNRTYGIHKTYTFNLFYEQYVVLSTMVPRNSSRVYYSSSQISIHHSQKTESDSRYIYIEISYIASLYNTYDIHIIYTSRA